MCWQSSPAVGRCAEVQPRGNGKRRGSAVSLGKVSPRDGETRPLISPATLPTRRWPCETPRFSPGAGECSQVPSQLSVHETIPIFRFGTVRISRSVGFYNFSWYQYTDLKEQTDLKPYIYIQKSQAETHRVRLTLLARWKLGHRTVRTCVHPEARCARCEVRAAPRLCTWAATPISCPRAARGVAWDSLSFVCGARARRPKPARAQTGCAGLRWPVLAAEISVP